jgi:hypothetical protein
MDSIKLKGCTTLGLETELSLVGHQCHDGLGVTMLCATTSLLCVHEALVLFELLCMRLEHVCGSSSAVLPDWTCIGTAQ